MQDSNKILITGTAGFIGFHLVSKLISLNFKKIIGIDIINDYYDVNLKHDRLALHGIDHKKVTLGSSINSTIYPDYKFYKVNLENQQDIEKIFLIEKPDIVINLAAQAGVRFSLTHPRDYIKSNIDGFLNILECCRHNKVKHLIYASSSSVYGLNYKLPFSTKDSVDHPISLYAASKKSNELMAHAYSYLFNLPTTGLRFFTVYGPWGRPDMALFLFTKAILAEEPIKLFNNGNMIRDFTYISDIVESISRLINEIPKKSENLTNLNSPARSIAPFKVFNIGNSTPVNLRIFINDLEQALNKKAIIESLPMQPGDVSSTHADISDLIEITKFEPEISTKVGINKFVNWYKEYYRK